MMRDPQAARLALDELRHYLQVVCLDSQRAADDEWLMRLADIDIALQSIEAIDAVTCRDQVRWNGVALRSIEIGRDIAGLIVDVLDWYAIAADPPGSNEPPIGGEAAGRLRSRYLEQLAIDETHLLGLRDELAAFLLELTRATS